MTLRPFGVSILCAAVLASLPSHAAFVQSTSAAAAGFTTTTIYGFTEAGLADGTAVTDQYSGVTFSAGIVQNPQDCVGLLPNGSGACLGNFPLGSGVATTPFTITFDSVQSEAGLNFSTNPGSPDSTFSAFLGALLVQSASFSADLLSVTDNFFGFEGISFDRIVVSVGGANTSALMDNLSFNASSVPVPEPGSLALAGLALAGLVALRRRSH